MTQNQINYQRHLEDVRHNKVSEAEAQRAALAAIQESRRHSQAMLAETYRHNTAQQQDWAQKNAINWNIASSQLAEQSRSNLAHEAIGRTNAWANVTQAQTGAYNAETGRYTAETGRINANTQIQSTANQYQLGLANIDVSKSNVAASIYRTETEAKVKSAQALAGLIPSVIGKLSTGMSGPKVGNTNTKTATRPYITPRSGGSGARR